MNTANHAFMPAEKYPDRCNRCFRPRAFHSGERCGIGGRPDDFSAHISRILDCLDQTEMRSMLSRFSGSDPERFEQMLWDISVERAARERSQRELRAEIERDGVLAVAQRLRKTS